MAQQKGILKTWKEDKGFGFIKPDLGGHDVFVHIRDFGNISRQPRVGDIIHFQPMKDKNGRSRAGDVQIEGLVRTAGSSRLRSPARSSQKKKSSNRFSFLVSLGVIILVALFGYNRLVGANLIGQSTTARDGDHATQLRKPEYGFECDGRQYCSQMRSRAEAEFFIRNCPDTKMDGDRDGVPCESDSRF